MGLTLDLERLEHDPVFSMLLQHSRTMPEVVQKYVAHYMGQETVLAEMPSTCGPADIYRMGVDVPALEAALVRAIPDYKAASPAAEELPSSETPACV